MPLFSTLNIKKKIKKIADIDIFFDMLNLNISFYRNERLQMLASAQILNVLSNK
jgi:hypothetical protein